MINVDSVNITNGGDIDNLYLTAHSNRVNNMQIFNIETKSGIRERLSVKELYQYYTKELGIKFADVSNCLLVYAI